MRRETGKSPDRYLQPPQYFAAALLSAPAISIALCWYPEIHPLTPVGILSAAFRAALYRSPAASPLRSLTRSAPPHFSREAILRWRCRRAQSPAVFPLLRPALGTSVHQSAVVPLPASRPILARILCIFRRKPVHPGNVKKTE